MVNMKQSSRTVSTITALALIAALSLSVVESAYAETYTLEQCLKLARENRASIVNAEGNKRNASAQKRSALAALLLPSVSLSARTSKSQERDQESQIPDFTQQAGAPLVYDSLQTVQGNFIPTALDTSSVPPVIDTSIKTIFPDDQDRTGSSMSISGSITLFDGFANVNSYLAAKKSSAMADYGMRTAEQDLALEVSRRYFDYLASVRNLTVQEEAVKRSEEQLNLVQSKYDVGSASLSDVLKQKVQFGNDNLALLEARQFVITSRANLAWSVGLDPSATNEFDTTYTERGFTQSLDEAIATGLENHPGLRSKELDVSVSKHYLNAAKGDYLPSVGASVTRTWSKGSSSDFLDLDLERSSTSTSFSISARWNIFDRFSREQTVASRSVRHNNARAGFAEERNTVALNITKAFYEVEKATEQVRVSEENVKSAREDMSLAQEKYNLGSAAILELLDAQVSLKDAQVRLISGKLNLNTAIAILHNAMGVSR